MERYLRSIDSNDIFALSIDDEDSFETQVGMSLLEWISAKDSQNDVEQIAQLCFRGLTQV